MVQLLCESGAQPNATAADDMTSLHFAAQKGHLDALCLLLAARAKASVVTRKGFTPLHFAVSNGSLDCVRALGKKTPEAMGLVNGKGQLPIHLAKSDEMKELLKKLEIEAAALHEKKLAQAKEKEENKGDAMGSKRRKHGSKEGGREEGEVAVAELGSEIRGTSLTSEIGPMMRGDGGSSGHSQSEAGRAALRDDVANGANETMEGKSIGPMMRPTITNEAGVSRKGSRERGGDDKAISGDKEGVGEVRLTALQRAKLRIKKPKIGLSHLEEEE